MFSSIKSKFTNLFQKLFAKKRDVEPKERKKYFDNRFIKYSDVLKQDKPIECSTELEELFEQICHGDIVYAHMPLSEEQLAKIPEGHRTRPYYIAYKLKYGFIAYNFSSSPYDKLSDNKTYYLSDMLYDKLPKKSYLDLSTSYYLPKDKLIRFICETKEKDFNEIQRRLWIGKRKEYEELYKEKPVICNPIPGDIINYSKEQWLILAETDNCYIALEVSKDNKKNFENGLFVHCNTFDWKVSLDNKKIIDKKDTIKTLHIVNREDFINLKRHIEVDRQAKNQKKKTKTSVPKYYTRFNIGTIFKDVEENEEYVYLYSNRSYDYCIKVSEYLNDEVYPEYTLYETMAADLVKTGEASDDELKQILLDQINYGNDKFDILRNRLKSI